MIFTKNISVVKVSIRNVIGGGVVILKIKIASGPGVGSFRLILGKGSGNSGDSLSLSYR